MNLKGCLKRSDGTTVVKAPDIKLNKYWSIEMGKYFDTLTRKPTNDFYVGLKFKIRW